MQPAKRSLLFLGLLLLVPVLSAWQSETTPSFTLDVGGVSCALVPAAEISEATPEPDATAEPSSGLEISDNALTPGAECNEVRERLVVAANGMLWMSVWLDGDTQTWLTLATLEDDDHPPKLDGRGRYFGCAL